MSVRPGLNPNPSFPLDKTHGNTGKSLRHSYNVTMDIRKKDTSSPRRFSMRQQVPTRRCLIRLTSCFSLISLDNRSVTHWTSHRLFHVHRTRLDPEVDQLFVQLAFSGNLQMEDTDHPFSLRKRKLFAVTSTADED